jgi:hypothetical protein
MDTRFNVEAQLEKIRSTRAGPDDDIEEYLERMEQAYLEVKGSAHKDLAISEKIFLDCVRRNLPSTWKVEKHMMENDPKASVKYAELRTRILQYWVEEFKIKQKNTKERALNVRHGHGQGGVKMETGCFNCGKNGHQSNKCKSEKAECRECSKNHLTKYHAIIERFAGRNRSNKGKEQTHGSGTGSGKILVSKETRGAATSSWIVVHAITFATTASSSLN